MSKRKGTQGAKGVEAKLREEEVVECSTSAASGECQEGSQHESEEGPEIRARKRWADVESDDEEEHFPGFGDLAEKTNVTTGTKQQPETETNPKHTVPESGDGKESVDEPAEEEWQEVTKKTKQSKPVQEDPARSGTRRDRGRGGDRRRKDGNGKDGKDGKDDKEKKEGQARRRDPKSGAQGDEKGTRRRGEQEKNGERKDQGKTREKKDVPKETWRKKNSEEDVQADKPKEGGGGAVEKKEVPKRDGNEVPKTADAKVPAERKTEKHRDSGRYHERQRKEAKENDSTQDVAPRASRQNSGRTDGRRERGGRRPGGGNGSQRASGPTAEDWFASRMQTAC